MHRHALAGPSGPSGAAGRINLSHEHHLIVLQNADMRRKSGGLRQAPEMRGRLFGNRQAFHRTPRQA